MAQEGLHAVTVQAVADAAGVSKGGFMHHFNSKQALVEAAVTELLETLSTDLAARMAADPVPSGTFTRPTFSPFLNWVRNRQAAPGPCCPSPPSRMHASAQSGQTGTRRNWPNITRPTTTPA